MTELRDALEPALSLLDDHPLSLYVTGSYGRLEAWKGSDIDVFFLHGGRDDEGPFPYTTFIQLSAALIEAAASMKFPPFTADGRYLEVQYVGQMERVLGSPQDDSLNAFTARMLLLLESRSLLNDEVYDDLLQRVISFYFRDYKDKQDSFQPIFLLNDILRFWRTLTLNYEHHRLQLVQLVGAELEAKKAASALKNFKLKISRLSTCFSMIAHLSSAKPPVSPSDVRELCSQTPSERFEALRGRAKKADDLLDALTAQYTDFLRITQQDESTLSDHFGDSKRRREALKAASEYGNTIYDLLLEITSPEQMRYLVI